MLLLNKNFDQLHGFTIGAARLKRQRYPCDGVHTDISFRCIINTIIYLLTTTYYYLLLLLLLLLVVVVLVVLVVLVVVCGAMSGLPNRRFISSRRHFI